MAIGMQLANYQQLLDAMAFLTSHGVELRELAAGTDARDGP